MQRPNILYIVVHDIGRHMGCYGVPVETPNLDAFAAQGMRFTNAFTNSVCCSPSRCCAMTGQYAHVSGGIGLAHMGWPLPERVRTVVDHFNDAGYETIHAGMQHERHEHCNRYEVDLQKDGSQHTENGVAEALDYLGKRDRTRPFYLNLGSIQPHSCSWALTEERHGGTVPPETVYLPPWMVDHPGVREKMGQFQAAIRYMDAHVGRLLDGIGQLGHDRDTVVVFTTDHGIHSQDDRAKGTLYDRGAETALLVRLPNGEKAGTTCDHLIQNIDFLPTLLEAAGVTAPENLPGKSFWPVLTGGDYTPHQSIFQERNFHGEVRYHGEEPRSFADFVDRYDPVRAVRTPEWHYIRYFDPGVKPKPPAPWEASGDCESPHGSAACLPRGREPRPKEELYHVRHDRLEFINLADRPELQGTKAELADKLQTWMEQTDDFVLTDNVPARYEKKQ